MDKVNQKDFIAGCNEKFKSAVDTEFRKLIKVDEKRILIVYIATGVYVKYFDDFYKTLQNLCPEVEKDIYVITDKVDYFESFKVKKISYERNYPWPIITLFKFHYIKEALDKLESEGLYYSHVCYFNSNIRFENIIKSDEYLKDKLEVVKHWEIYTYGCDPKGYGNQNKNSVNYIENPISYFQAGNFCCPRNLIDELCDGIINSINIDLSNNVIADWHDESAYQIAVHKLINKGQCIILSGDYMCNEEDPNSMTKFNCKIKLGKVSRDKDLNNFKYGVTCRLNTEINLKDLYLYPNQFKDLLTTSGPLIYRIHNIITDKSYIGKTDIDLQYRFFDAWYGGHFALYEDESCNIHLYNSMRKYGLENFRLSILSLDKSEKHYIELYDSYHNGYNKSSDGLGRFIKGVESQNKGKLRIYKGNEFRLINKEDFDTYKLHGWIRGCGFDRTKGKIWIHNKFGERTLVDPNQLDHYCNHDWKLGSGYSASTNKIWIYKDNGEITYVDEYELSNKLASGWKLGRGYSNKLYVVNKENNCVLISESEVAEYYKKGYAHGRNWESAIEFEIDEDYKELIL